jgi:hypothetical protein
MDEAEEYEAEDIYDLIDQLLDEWVEGDAHMPGVFAFLADHGYDLGIADDDVDEGTDESVLQTAADAVRILINTEAPESLEKLALFLSAISGEYTIEGPGAGASEKEEDESDSAEAEDEADKAEDEADKADDEGKAAAADEDEAAGADADAEDEDEDDEELDEEFEKQMDEDYDY